MCDSSIIMLWTLPFTVVFASLGFLIIFHSLRTMKGKKRSITFDELLLGAFHLIMVFIYPVIYSKYESLAPLLFTVTSVFLALTLIAFTVIILKERNRVNDEPYFKKKRSYSAFKEAYHKFYLGKNMYKRRITHVIPVAVILPIYLISKSLAPVFPQWEAFSVCFIVTIGASFTLAFSIADLIRINSPHLIPDWVRRFYLKGLKDEEVEFNTFTTTSAMVLGFAPWLLAGFLVFTVVSLVASVSDAMAAITGFRFGRRRFPKKSKKTVEGYIAGILTTFGLVIMAFFILSRINPVYIFIIGALTALAFFIVDVLNLPVDDNKINPHVIGAVTLLLLSILLFI